VLFPIPTTTVTSPTSTGVRLRLSESDLAAADSYTVTVADPAETVTNGSGPFRFTVVPVRATSVASLPDSLIHGAQSNELSLTIHGGYVGPGGQPTVASFLGNTIPKDSTTVSTARQLNLAFPTTLSSSTNPGLYPLSIASTSTPAPLLNNPSVTNLALFPN